jgi:hypothetical protein
VSPDVVALLVIFAAHLVALVVLVGPLRRCGPQDDEGAEGSSDDDGGGGLRRPLGDPPSPRPDGHLPLPDAVPSSLRLRGPGLLADHHRARPRRHGAPAPARIRLRG